MMSRFKTSRSWIFYVALGVISVIFITLASGYTSPLYKDWNGADSAFFIMVGSGMKRGLLPYRDFFDQKGPYLFFIQYIGQLIADGRTGAYIMQIINLFVILLFSAKIYDLYDDKKSVYIKLLTFIPLLLFMYNTMERGNLTEEYCNSFTFIALYFYLKHILRSDRKTPHPPVYAFIYGLCFGVISLIRIDNGLLICIIILSVLIYGIKAREYKNVFINLLCGLAGLACTWIPPVIFFLAYGQLGVMLRDMFVVSFSYLRNSDISERTYLFYALALCVPAFCAVFVKNASRQKLRLFYILSSAAFIVYFTRHNTYLHYFETALPLVMMGAWSLAPVISERSLSFKKDFRKLTIGAIFVAALVFIVPIRASLANVANSYLRIFTDVSKTEIETAREVSDMIPEVGRSSVVAYNVAPNWYNITGIFPADKYCCWQERYIQIDSRIANDIEKMFKTNPPEYIVTNVYADFNATRIAGYMKGGYELIFQNETYCLFKKL